MTAPIHAPVLLAEVVAALAPRDGEVHVDATFGAGGYTRALLEAADCRVVAIDRDPAAVERARRLADAFAGRLEVVEGRFGEMDRLVRSRHDGPVAGVAMDVGVSSDQLDRPERGFSFRHDGPLDMRMSQAGPTAADFVNTASEQELAQVIHELGEERHARRIARAIVLARTAGAILRTGRLADIVRRAAPAAGRDVIDPATRTFQALRIHVNDELGELDHGLSAAERLLSPGGRLAVVSFHSLEDRRVKAFLRARSGEIPAPSRHQPRSALEPHRAPTFRLLHRRAVRPGDPETTRNPRARSARLRAAVRTDAAAWPAEAA